MCAHIHHCKWFGPCATQGIAGLGCALLQVGRQDEVEVRHAAEALGVLQRVVKRPAIIIMWTDAHVSYESIMI